VTLIVKTEDGAKPSPNDWQHLPDGEALPAKGNVIVSLNRWKDQRTALDNHAGQVGVLLTGEDHPQDLRADLDDLPLIALDFPKFADGRGYSKAFLLRVHLDYAGQLRAVGEVLRDQLWHMSRVGIDAFELSPGKSVEDALKAFSVHSVRYQASVDEPLPIYRQTGT
jgi:uncharacterized protein (DUF934 family)